MNIFSDVQNGICTDFFDLLHSHYSANNLSLETNNSFYFIDHVSEHFPSGYTHYFVENAAEHLGIIGNAIKFIKNGSADLLIGSFLHPKHKFYNRTVSMPHNYMQCIKWYTCPEYFYSLSFKETCKKHNLTFINGQNRTIRNYFLDQTSKYCDNILNNGKTVETFYNSLASIEDIHFAKHCNKKYDFGKNIDKFIGGDQLYFGIDGKFGSSSKAYYPIEEYLNSNCVVYPESTFYNWELYPTEKTWKCIKANTHFIFFSGAGSYEILREIGFRSIVELCPDKINDFDTDTDHMNRIEKIAKCCDYIQKNNHIFNSIESKNILKENYVNFHNPVKIIEKSANTFKKYL